MTSQRMCELECKEMVHRTTLVCDEASDFQRLISLYIASRHGTWGFSQENTAPEQFCKFCGRNQADAVEEEELHKVQVDVRGNRMETPLCGLDELYSDKGCRYTAEVLEMMRRREEYHKNISPVLERIAAASQGIQSAII
ncbi:hypothetical protein ADEAN_000168100 [Angomonas deanei]|uniref:Uncharacterized protein n=1 Tax=Angomonas deanei TaxID=59799 RepID=A0A7G2C3F5_9TRYP|nr:hypothetical protein ADEAN_000168100 [Angomonas deanei]